MGKLESGLPSSRPGRLPKTTTALDVMDHHDSCLPERSLQHFWTIISRPCVEPALGRTATRRRTINFGTELCYLKPNLRCGERKIT